MNISTTRNKNGDLITVEQACELTNLGRTSVRKLAVESGAGRKIGRCFRIKKAVFLDFIDRVYSE